jgi:hypothetical protein
VIVLGPPFPTVDDVAVLLAERAAIAAVEIRDAEEAGPYVCPTCYAVAEPCAPWCWEPRYGEERDYPEDDRDDAEELPW